MPLVSIIIPCFNQGRYLREAIGSALAQTHAEIEVMVVDDGSTDDTAAVAQSFASDPRVRLIRQANAGLTAARIAGIAASRGVYLNFLDADDRLAADKLATQLAVLEEDSALGFCYCEIAMIDAEGRPLAEQGANPVGAARQDLSGDIFDALMLGGYFPPHTVLLRRSAYDAVGGFDPDLGGYADWELWARLAGSGHRAFFVDTVLAIYRIHEASMTRSDQPHMRRDEIQALSKILARFPARLPQAVSGLRRALTVAHDGCRWLNAMLEQERETFGAAAVAAPVPVAEDDGAIVLQKPLLPDAQALEPYLRVIDAGRRYTGGGPLFNRLRERLGEYFDTSAANVVTVANGTQALSLALQAMGAPAGTLCMLPSWALAGAGHAAVAAGLVPWFVDVDADGVLHPDAARDMMARAPGPVGAVMPVAPFGRPLAWKHWDDFRARTGMAVVINAAHAFDSAEPVEVPVVISLHATKVFAAGEGGVVLCRDRGLIDDVFRRGNQGMFGSRLSLVPGTNARMSEHQAALCLAALDRWPAFRRKWGEGLTMLGWELGLHAKIALPQGLGQDWVASMPVVRLPHAAAAVAARLNAEAIPVRLPCDPPIHDHPAFAAYPRGALDNTADLAAHCLHLPFSLDMAPAQIRRVAIALGQALAGGKQ